MKIMEKLKEYVKKMDRRLLVAGITLLVLLGIVIPLGLLFDEKKQFASCKKSLILAQQNECSGDITNDKKCDCAASDPAEDTVTQERTLIASIDVEGTKIAAYEILDPLSGNLWKPGAFIVILEKGYDPPRIFSTTGRYGTNENVMDIVDNKLFVVNGQMNSIDIYGIVIGKPSDYKAGSGIPTLTTHPSHLYFMESFKLPTDKYDLGEVFSVECEETTCEINTMKKPDTGCTVDLDIDTGKYSNASCLGPNGTFVPTKE
jgi:hypothetical protein